MNRCKVHLAKQVMEELNTKETYKHIDDSTIKEVQIRHAEWMMQENLVETQDEQDPNAIHILEYRRLFPNWQDQESQSNSTSNTSLGSWHAAARQL